MKTGFSYFGVRRPLHALKDMEEMLREGCTQVLHTWSEDDQAYYRGSMAEIVRGSRALGLDVYVNSWGVGRVFGGEAGSELCARNPDSCQVLSTGERVAAICPNHPAFREYMDEWIDTVCEAGPSAIFWDEPHFFFRKGSPAWSCRCPSCRSLFQDRFGFDMPSDRSPELAAFRQERLLALLSRWTERVRSHGVRNNVCLLPDTFDAGLPDWEAVAALPSLDELSTDPYWPDDGSQETVESDYRLYSAHLVEICRHRGLEPQMWIKLYRIRGGTEHFAPLAARISAGAGIANLMAWSWRASEWLSWLRSDDPSAAHEALVREFRNLGRP